MAQQQTKTQQHVLLRAAVTLARQGPVAVHPCTPAAPLTSPRPPCHTSGAPLRVPATCPATPSYVPKLTTRIVFNSSGDRCRASTAPNDRRSPSPKHPPHPQPQPGPPLPHPLQRADDSRRRTSQPEAYARPPASSVMCTGTCDPPSPQPSCTAARQATAAHRPRSILRTKPIAR